MSNFDRIGKQFEAVGAICVIERQDDLVGSDFSGFIDLGDSEASKVSHDCREKWWYTLCGRFNQKEEKWKSHYYRESNLPTIEIDSKYSSLVIPPQIGAPKIIAKLDGIVCVYPPEQTHSSNNESNEINNSKTKPRNDLDENDSDSSDKFAAVLNDFKNSLGFTMEYKFPSKASVTKATKLFGNNSKNCKNNESNSKSNSKSSNNSNNNDNSNKRRTRPNRNRLTGKKRKFGAIKDDMDCSHSIVSSSAKSTGKPGGEKTLWQTVGSYLASILIVTHGKPVFSISTSMNDLEDGWFVYYSKRFGLTAVKLRMRQIMHICYAMMAKGSVSDVVVDIGCHPAQGKGQVALQSWVCFVLLCLYCPSVTFFVLFSLFDRC